MINIFITGTDTGIGKTRAAVTLINEFNARGFSTFGMKPIASGCRYDENNCLINDDATAMQRAATVKKLYHEVNPYSFIDPISPNLAALRAGMKLSVSTITKIINKSLEYQQNTINIIEGVGGWCVPINDAEQMSDIVCAFNFSVILVVGVKLGCLNHAILTSQQILQSKLPFVGWIANCLDPNMLEIQGNIETLKKKIPSSYLGMISYSENSYLLNELDMEGLFKSLGLETTSL